MPVGDVQGDGRGNWIVGIPAIEGTGSRSIDWADALSARLISDFGHLARVWMMVHM
jgi:hypothetical protein